jgi:hypothetical protein
MPEETVAALMSMLKSLSGDIRAHGDAVAKIESKLEMLLAALGGEKGLLEHRLYHERQHSAAAFWEEVRSDVTKATVRALTWSVLVAAVTLLGMGILYWAQKTLGIK